jgi:hypothetical protein
VREQIHIKREVEVEAGREYVWWTVIDRESGYNKTYHSEEEAKAHAAEVANRIGAGRELH